MRTTFPRRRPVSVVGLLATRCVVASAGRPHSSKRHSAPWLSGRALPSGTHSAGTWQQLPRGWVGGQAAPMYAHMALRHGACGIVTAAAPAGNSPPMAAAGDPTYTLATILRCYYRIVPSRLLGSVGPARCLYQVGGRLRLPNCVARRRRLSRAHVETTAVFAREGADRLGSQVFRCPALVSTPTAGPRSWTGCSAHSLAALSTRGPAAEARSQRSTWQQRGRRRALQAPLWARERPASRRGQSPRPPGERRCRRTSSLQHAW